MSAFRLAFPALATASLLLSACVPASDAVISSPPPKVGDALERPPSWKLAWTEEFDKGAAPDPENWSYETLRNAKGWYNGELQYYSRDRRENARIENGKLVIEVRRDGRTSRLEEWSGQRFTSARLTTKEKRSWRHGYFEVRAKLPCVRGAWPAIWLLPEYQDIRWQGGEIDIVEAVGYEPDTIHHAIQTAERNFTKGNHEEGLSRVSYCDSWHDYQLLWTEDRVVMGVDGRVGFVAQPSGFDRRMSFILNVAVGGEWAGARGIDTDAFPARMEIESIRVWQARGE